MRQNAVSNTRNHAQLSRMRTLIKNIIKWTEGGEVKKAEGAFNETQKSIDTCSKKNLIHKNNAARKKSRIARIIALSKKTPLKEEVKETKKPKKAPVAKMVKEAPAEEVKISEDEKS